MTVPFALSVHTFVKDVGADAGFASIIGLALLVLLYFAQMRETRTLRDRLEEAAGRVGHLENRLAHLSRAQGAQPAVAPAPAIAARPMGAAVAALRRGSASAVARGAGMPAGAPAGVAGPALLSATRLIPIDDQAPPSPAGAPVTAAPAVPPVSPGPSRAPAAPAAAPGPPAADRAPAAVPASAVPAPARAVPVPLPAGAVATAAASPSSSPLAVAASDPGSVSSSDAGPAPSPATDSPPEPVSPADAAAPASGSPAPARAPMTGAGATAGVSSQDTVLVGPSTVAAGANGHGPLVPFDAEALDSAPPPPPPPPAPPRQRTPPSLPAPTPDRRSRRRRGSPSRVRGFLSAVIALVVVGAGVAVLLGLTNGSTPPRKPKLSSHRNSRHRTATRRHTVVAFKPASVTVAVLNGTPISHLAEDVWTKKLSSVGYKEGTIWNAFTQTQTSTVVSYRPGHEAGAAQVAKSLGLGASAVAPVTSTAIQECSAAPTQAGLGTTTGAGSGTCTANVIVTLGTDLQGVAQNTGTG